MLESGGRRLLLAASGAVTAFVVLAGCQTMPGGNDAKVFNQQLEALIMAGHFSAHLGRKHLENVGSLANAALGPLGAEIMNGLSGLSDDLPAELRRKMQQDFASGRLCQLDGWQLSATECRLVAFAFLLRQSKSPVNSLPEASIARLERWGPRSGRTGEGVNLQSDGSSAFWFVVGDLEQHPYYVIYFGASPLKTMARGHRSLITAVIPKAQASRLFSVQDEVPVHLVDLLHGSKQLMGYFYAWPREDAAVRR